MPEVTEGQLTFHFPSEWQAISYDAPGGFYKTVVQCSPLDFKAVDILACSTTDTCIWIEVKGLAQAIRSRLHFLKLNQVTVCNEQTIPPNAAWSVTRNAV